MKLRFCCVPAVGRFLAVLALVTFGCMGCKAKNEAAPAQVQEADEEPEVPEWKELYEAWDEPDPIPPFDLVSHEGAPVSLDDFDDKFILMGFVFTRCQVPEACPLTMKKMKEVQGLWKRHRADAGIKDKDLQIIGVTLDPEFDTPDILKKYLIHHGGDPASWSMVTGPEELVVTALPSLFNVMALPDGKGSINHSVKVALLRPGRLFLKEWRDNKFRAADVVKIISDYDPGKDATP